MLLYLCDDSMNDILKLKYCLNEYAKEKKLCFEMESFSSGQELLTAYEQAEQKPGLMFLDILMMQLSGVEVARILRENHYEGGIIFTTASTEHAMDSYEVNALYYLEKPYERRHFDNAMQRCSSLLQRAKPNFVFSVKKKEISVPCEEIVYFETGQSHTIVLHTTSDVYSFSGSLTPITEYYDNNSCFLPIGRSFLINMEHISGRQGKDLIMSDGTVVQVPFRKQKETFDALEKWKQGGNPASLP